MAREQAITRKYGHSGNIPKSAAGDVKMPLFEGVRPGQDLNSGSRGFYKAIQHLLAALTMLKLAATVAVGQLDASSLVITEMMSVLLHVPKWYSLDGCACVVFAIGTRRAVPHQPNFFDKAPVCGLPSTKQGERREPGSPACFRVDLRVPGKM